MKALIIAFQFLRQHWVLVSSTVALIVAVVTRLPQVIESTQRLKRYLRHVPDSATVANAELDLDSNVRFCFRFKHPATWDRRDPHNSDGATYTHPKYTQVEVRGWGSYAVVWPTLEEWTRESLRSEGRSKDSCLTKVHSVADSGRYMIRATPKTVSREKIDGRRAVYDMKIDGKRFRAMQQFTQFDNRQIAVRCLAPSYLYAVFEELFLRVCSSLEVVAEAQPPQQILNRRKAVIDLLRALKVNEVVTTDGIYAGMLASHPQLMEGVDRKTLEQELTKMAEEGAIFYERLVGAWAFADPRIDNRS